MSKNIKIGLIDYEAGNLFAIYNACIKVGASPEVITKSHKNFDKFDYGGQGLDITTLHLLSDFCAQSGSETSWADINGDGKADLICDDTSDNH